MHRTAIRPFAAAACSAVLALALAGCGDDDKKDDSSSGATALTAEEFKTQADAICKAQDANEERTFTAAQQAATSGDDAAAKAALDEGVAVIRGEAEAIAALEAPDELKADVEDLVSSLNAALDKVASEGIGSISALAEPSDKAKALGLQDCGN